MTDLQDAIDAIDTLKPIPPVATQILILTEDLNNSLTEIKDLILHDPTITANVLRMCNSAYFGLARKVESVHDAIMLLGLDRIIELVLTVSLSDTFIDEYKGYGLGEGELWRHALLSAHVAKTLVNHYGISANKHLVFTAALLKDIGKLILGRYVAFSLEKINILVHSRGYSFDETEKEVIGMNHEELGALIAEKWRFAEKLIYIIQNHHLLDKSARVNSETVLIYLADIVCMLMAMNTGVDRLAYQFYGDALKRMQLTEDDLQQVIIETNENRENIDGLLNLV
ncbi:MAG: HDOD domain-containing protein [candidate division WOR-3 bacterium]|nr:MAG: HDOD domain-containing protein [candidate division WOR-3 bacterium]